MIAFVMMPGFLIAAAGGDQSRVTARAAATANIG